MPAALPGRRAPSTPRARGNCHHTKRRTLLAVVVLVVAAGLGLLLASRFGARFGVAAALAWGLAWIAVGRLGSNPRSTMVGVVSAATAAVVVLSTVALRRRKSVGEAVAA